MKTFFHMCMNEYERMNEGGNTLYTYMRQYLGEWYAASPEVSTITNEVHNANGI